MPEKKYKSYKFLFYCPNTIQKSRIQSEPTKILWVQVTELILRFENLWSHFTVCRILYLTLYKIPVGTCGGIVSWGGGLEYKGGFLGWLCCVTRSIASNVLCVNILRKHRWYPWKSEVSYYHKTLSLLSFIESYKYSCYFYLYRG